MTIADMSFVRNGDTDSATSVTISHFRRAIRRYAMENQLIRLLLGIKPACYVDVFSA